MIGSKFSRHFFNQSQVKPKPILARACTFSRALCRLRVVTSSFDWFTGLSPSFLIGQGNYFGFGFTTLDWNSLYDHRKQKKMQETSNGIIISKSIRNEQNNRLSHKTQWLKRGFWFYVSLGSLDHLNLLHCPCVATKLRENFHAKKYVVGLESVRGR